MNEWFLWSIISNLPLLKNAKPRYIISFFDTLKTNILDNNSLKIIGNIFDLKISILCLLLNYDEYAISLLKLNLSGIT
jgi:hypothetical protein